MTSRYGNTFRITGPLWGESHHKGPVMRGCVFVVESLIKLYKQLSCRWFEMSVTLTWLYNVSITLHCVEGDRNLGYWVAPIIHIAFYEDITWCYDIYERLCSNVAQDFAPKAHKLGGHRCSVIRSRPAGNYTWIERGMIIVHIYTTMVVTSRRGWYHQN